MMTRADRVLSTPRRFTPKIIAGTDLATEPSGPNTPAREKRKLPATSAPTLRAFPFKIYADGLFALPFVTMPSEEDDFESWGAFWKSVDMWNDKPTDKSHVDYARGRDYARAAINATLKENASSRGLEIIVERMIEKAFRRRGRKGALCPKLSSSEEAFLTEICRIAVEGR
jgi:hypothetical protein